jgi:hypothetical protein
MIVQCPHCGERVVVNGLGRKRLNIPLKNICEALRLGGDVAAAARELNCSQGYIFNTLKAHGLKPRDIIEKRVQVTNNEGNTSMEGVTPLGLLQEVMK